MSEEKVIPMEKAKKAEPKTRKKATKKVTTAQLKKAVVKNAERKSVLITMNGEEFVFEIDTVVLPSKRAELENSVVGNLSELMGDSPEEVEQNKLYLETTFGSDKVEGLFSLLGIADMLRIFSDFEIENTTVGKIEMINLLGDAGILSEITANIPDEIFEAFEEVSESLKEKADKLREKINELEQELSNIEKAEKAKASVEPLNDK